MSNHQLNNIAYKLFEEFGLFVGKHSHQSIVAQTFFGAIEKKYRSSNPYHNFRHGVDVTQTISYVLVTGGLAYLDEAQVCALLVASLGHDIDHPGVNNDFLKSAETELALRYNDISPLENHHCATLFEIISYPKCDVLQAYAKQRKELRKMIIDAILATDNAYHFELLKQLDNFGAGAVVAPTAWKTVPLNEKQIAINTMLHLSDISNPAYPFEASKRWSDLVLEEFFRQGDKEKQVRYISDGENGSASLFCCTTHTSRYSATQMGLPLGFLNDRTTVRQAECSLNFIDIIVAPMFASAIRILPGLKPCASQLKQNRQQWEVVRQERAKKDEQVASKAVQAQSGEGGKGAAATRTKEDRREEAKWKMRSTAFDSTLLPEELLQHDDANDLSLSRNASLEEHDSPPFAALASTAVTESSVDLGGGGGGSDGSRSPASKPKMSSRGVRGRRRRSSIDHLAAFMVASSITEEDIPSGFVKPESMEEKRMKTANLKVSLEERKRAPRPISGKLRLLVTTKSGTTKKEKLERGHSYSIGRSKDNYIQLARDRTVSRQHLVLDSAGDALRLKDLGSKFGTFLNGEKCQGGQWYFLLPEDRIDLGTMGSRFVFYAKELGSWRASHAGV